MSIPHLTYTNDTCIPDITVTTVTQYWPPAYERVICCSKPGENASFIQKDRFYAIIIRNRAKTDNFSSQQLLLFFFARQTQSKDKQQ